MPGRGVGWLLLAIIVFCSSIAAARWGTDSNYNQVISGGGGGYTGPGDIVSGASVFWGLRCYNNAYSGNVADIWDGATGSTTETLLTCSSGGTINQTINTLATTCAVSCKVKELYDQSGNGININQNSNGARPVLTLNCLNSTLPCITNTTSTGYLSAADTIAQPYSISIVMKRTAAASAGIIDDQASGNGLNGNSGANTLVLISPTSATFTASDNSNHAIQAIFNTTNSIANVDGTTTSGLNSGTGGIGAGGIDFALASYTGTIAEVGIWPVAFNSTQYGNMCHNQFTYWATSTSC